MLAAKVQQDNECAGIGSSRENRKKNTRFCGLTEVGAWTKMPVVAGLLLRSSSSTYFLNLIHLSGDFRIHLLANLLVTERDFNATEQRRPPVTTGSNEVAETAFAVAP